MAKLVLKFEGRVLRQVPVDSRGVGIGRAPNNDVQIDNLAVSNHHARVFFENERLTIEDLHSLNGTFVNHQRIERATLKDGDSVQIGKHFLVVVAGPNEAGGAAFATSATPKVATPKVEETMVLDTRLRREMQQQAAAAGERSQVAPARVRVATLVVLAGKTDASEYLLSGKLTVIGKSSMATVRLQGWFAPQVAAQITQRDDGYYIGRGDRVPSVNGRPISGPTRLNEGDLIEISNVKLNFVFRD